MNHGGARPGAGRKRNPMRAVKIPIWLISRIDAAKRGDEPRWKVVARLIEADGSEPPPPVCENHQKSPQK